MDLCFSLLNLEDLQNLGIMNNISLSELPLNVRRFQPFLQLKRRIVFAASLAIKLASESAPMDHVVLVVAVQIRGHLDALGYSSLAIDNLISFFFVLLRVAYSKVGLAHMLGDGLCDGL